MLRRVLHLIEEFASIAIPSLLIAAFLNLFIVANATVPTSSMEKTIMTGSRVIGFRLQYLIGSPERGDIVMFKFGYICKNCGAHVGYNDDNVCTYCGEDLHGSSTLHYVKRLIGLPGDHVEIKGDPLNGATVYVNGEKLDEPYINGVMDYYMEKEWDIPESEYLFLGDNRNDSWDARFWNDPFVERDRIEAKILLAYYPTFKVLH